MLVHHDQNGRWDELSFEGSLREGMVMLANLREEDHTWGCRIALMLGGGRGLSHGGWLWSGVKSHFTPNLVGRGYIATTAKGLAILHVSAHSHTDPGNSSRPGLHSNKEAIPMMRE